MNSMKFQAGVCSPSDPLGQFTPVFAHATERKKSRIGSSLYSLEQNITLLHQIVVSLEARLQTVASGGSAEKCADKSPMPQESSNIADKIDKAAGRIVNINANLNDLLDRLEV